MLTCTPRVGRGLQVWFPTPRAIQMRIEAAVKEGVGISIWELGQGMARFMELL